MSICYQLNEYCIVLYCTHLSSLDAQLVASSYGPEQVLARPQPKPTHLPFPWPSHTDAESQPYQCASSHNWVKSFYLWSDPTGRSLMRWSDPVFKRVEAQILTVSSCAWPDRLTPAWHDRISLTSDPTWLGSNSASRYSKFGHPLSDPIDVWCGMYFAGTHTHTGACLCSTFTAPHDDSAAGQWTLYSKPCVQTSQYPIRTPCAGRLPIRRNLATWVSDVDHFPSRDTPQPEVVRDVIIVTAAGGLIDRCCP